MKVFGELKPSVADSLHSLVTRTSGLRVSRDGKARSSTPFPKSTDLELALKPLLLADGFKHHVTLQHPRLEVGFEYDFWRELDGMAIEVMGYRADDEVYKDILKFHVHSGTRIGVVLVPRWKWISERRTEANAKATLKALAFADSFLSVEALVAIAYDWTETAEEGVWALRHCDIEAD